MIDTIRADNISANIGRAAQHEIEGDSISELRFLLFAAHDIVDVLQEYRLSGAPTISPTEWMLPSTAKRYAKLLGRISKRAEEIVNEGL